LTNTTLTAALQHRKRPRGQVLLTPNLALNRTRVRRVSFGTRRLTWFRWASHTAKAYNLPI
jgi:hypothetical protein